MKPVLPTVSDYLQSYTTPSPSECAQNLLERKGNRGSVLEKAEFGAAAVALIIKHNGGKQTLGKTKGRTICWERNSGGKKAGCGCCSGDIV